MIKHLALAAVAVGLMASPSTASMVIDDFGNIPAQTLLAPSTGPSVALTGDVSGTRTLTRFAGSGFGATSAGGGSFLNQVTSTSMMGAVQTRLAYAFDTAIDLHSTGSGIANNPVLFNLFDTVIGDWEVMITYASDLFGSVDTGWIAIADGSDIGSLAVDGRDFGNGALASSVDDITIDFRALSLGTIDAGIGAQLSSTSAMVTAVPEPTSIALLGLTGIGGVIAVNSVHCDFFLFCTYQTSR
ncbi:MAG: PEP-CTERM sorting domain-containing protein [Planctomycetaceae bacterium]|nr:PEP-CTERM sorting domain-containing protein [Planctomycetaceae bacterium]